MSNAQSPPTTATRGAARRGSRGVAIPEPQIVMSRLALATLVAAVLAAVANSLIRLGAVWVFDIPAAFEPLEPVSPAQASTVAALGAAAVLALLAKFTQHPVRWFYRVSAVVFVLSFLPLVIMGLEDPPPYPGTDAGALGTLALMHVVSLVLTVPVLAQLSSRPRR